MKLRFITTISPFVSVAGAKVRLDPNNEPVRPVLLPGADDFKLYQRFIAEAEFVNGKVVSAKFREMKIRAGTTLKKKAKIYVKTSKISKWKGQNSVTFTRTVEGHPASLFMFTDEVVTGKPFRPIFNTLSVEIRGDRVIPRGDGSAFPSHKFWHGSTLFSTKTQVKPAAYFK